MIWPGLSSCIGLFLVIAATTARAETPAYVGSAVCADCHADVTADWDKSDHAKAWTLPDETTVLGDFDNAEFEHGGQLTRFLRDGDRFLIETEGPDGVRRAYEVVGVAGIDPLQQYLLSPEPGRVQTYDIAWDVEGARWYPVFPDQVAFPGDVSIGPAPTRTGTVDAQNVTLQGIAGTTAPSRTASSADVRNRRGMRKLPRTGERRI